MRRTLFSLVLVITAYPSVGGDGAMKKPGKMSATA
jgi:hypothetical protein